MPSASNNNQSNIKLVKQTSVNSMNSGGVSGTSVKTNKKITENVTKSNNTTVVNTNDTETSSVKTAKENTNNVVAAAAQQQNSNSKNWETASATGNATNNANKDTGSDSLNPMKLTFTTIEHKIRNLEKRKTKLEGYRAIQASGKELSSDQRAAVAKYDAVIATLEFARDLVKQMQQFAKDAEKEQKKQARKELIAKAQAETVKIREVLIIQNILSCFTDDAVRNDFLAGENGAAKLEPNEIDILEKFCSDVQTRRPETSEDAPFATSAQKAAEVFSMTIDARPKQYGETTYENVRRIFHRIQESDYLDKIYLTDVVEPEIKNMEDDAEKDTIDNNDDFAVKEINNQEQDVNSSDDHMEKLNVDATNLPPTNTETPITNGLMGQQHQAIIKEHLDLQQQQVTLPSLPSQPGQPLLSASMAPAVTAIPSFQPAPRPAHSGATTPVHVAMYHPSLQQPTPQLQQMQNSGAIIAGVPTNPAGQMIASLPAQQGVQNAPPVQATQQQQRQVLTSPAGEPIMNGGNVTLHNANHPQQPPPSGHFNPTPVHAVEQSFFKHQPPHTQQQPQQQQQQFLQQIRPLAEVIGSGNFYFLQDSELDSPDINNQVQDVPQNTIVFEQQQQQPHQNLQQNKLTRNVQEQNAETNAVVPNQQQQLQQINQQIPFTQKQPQTSTQTPIQTQTFTNQSFPQIPLPQTHTSNAAILNSNTPSPLFQQQPQSQQQQHQKVTNTSQQLFSPVQNQNLSTPQQQQPSQLILAGTNEVQQQQQPQPALMMINRLAGPPTAPLIQQQSHPQQPHPQQPHPQQSHPQQPHPQQPHPQPPHPQQPHPQHPHPQQPHPQQPHPQQPHPQQPHPQQPHPQQPHPQQTIPQQPIPQQPIPQQPIPQQPIPQQPIQQPPHQQLPRQQQQHQPQPPQVLLQQITPQTRNLVGSMQQLPNPPASDMSQTSKNVGFSFENPVIAGINYEQEMQNKLNSATNILKNSLNVMKAHTTQLNKKDLINEWDETVLKSSTNQQDYKSSPSTVQVVESSNKWNAEANTASPITVQQTQTRKNEWTSSNVNNPSNATESTSYSNDNRSDSNHWHSQESGGYGRGGGGNRGHGGGPNTGGYQRPRNDDRRDDRRPGGNGGGGGGYRGRSNYGSGNPQQNSQPRSGGGTGGNVGGIYFRNNENTNAYYQNGTGSGGGNVYSNKDSRYDSRVSGGGNYRGPRGSDNSTNSRSNGPPPRHMSNRASGGNSNAANINSNTYMNSRQPSNRMPLSIENKN